MRLLLALLLALLLHGVVAAVLLRVAIPSHAAQPSEIAIELRQSPRQNPVLAPNLATPPHKKLIAAGRSAAMVDKPSAGIAAVSSTNQDKVAPLSAEGVVKGAGIAVANGGSSVAAVVSGSAGGGAKGGDAFQSGRGLAAAYSRILAHRHYPEIARRRELEGDVRLKFSVSSDGNVRHLRSFSEADPELIRAAEEAVQDAVPLPPIGDVDIVISFRLNDE